MKKRINRELLEKILYLLGERLNLNKSPHTELIVCGGSSLIAMNFIIRSTQDVDVVAFLSPEKELKKAKPLPDFLVTAARQVAQDLQLDENWLNSGPADLLDLGMPEGFVARLHSRDFGNSLAIHFVGRLDQIHFKLYATVDQGPGRHLEDLLALNPTSEEIGRAVHWVRTHDGSEGFRQLLKDMLGSIGYEEIARTI